MQTNRPTKVQTQTRYNKQYTQNKSYIQYSDKKYNTETTITMCGEVNLIFVMNGFFRRVTETVWGWGWGAV